MKKIFYVLLVLFSFTFIQNVNAKVVVQSQNILTNIEGCSTSNYPACITHVAGSSANLLKPWSFRYYFKEDIDLTGSTSFEIGGIYYYWSTEYNPTPLQNSYNVWVSANYSDGNSTTCQVTGVGMFNITCPSFTGKKLHGIFFFGIGPQNYKVGLSYVLTSYYEASNEDMLNSQHQDSQNEINAMNKNSQKEIDAMNKNAQQQHADNQKQLDEAKKQTDFITSDEAPNSDISVLGDVQGIFPPGPVDSLLNIPFQFLSVMTSSFSGTCKAISISDFMGTNISIPCFSEMIYDNVPDYVMIFMDLIPTGFILIIYFKHLYKKVDRAVSMETNSDDEWGVI